MASQLIGGVVGQGCALCITMFFHTSSSEIPDLV